MYVPSFSTEDFTHLFGYISYVDKRSEIHCTVRKLSEMNRRTLSKQMTTKHNRAISSCWIYMLLLTLDLISHCCVEGFQTLDKNSFGPKPEGTIKTIEVLDDGDMIDCVLIYKQPAFNNPLFKELKINSISYPSVFNKTKDPRPKLLQAWNKYGECPEGTIPIRRTMNNNDTYYPKTSNAPSIHEYATLVHKANNCKGGRARLNVWKPSVPSLEELSLSQIWVVSGSGAELNSIEAGWVVYPRKYRSPKPRFFIYYTPDGYRTKCWDLDCGGFFQVDREFVLGKALEHISVYNGEQIDTLISISRDKVEGQGHWWLQVDDTVVGFWPNNLFTTLRDGATSVAFGGEIVNENYRVHTGTKMGSGHFSVEGYKKACYTSNIEIVNDAYEWVEPHLQLQAMTRRECYDLSAGPLLTNLGSHFYFGGPGLNEHCR